MDFMRQAETHFQPVIDLYLDQPCCAQTERKEVQGAAFLHGTYSAPREPEQNVLQVPLHPLPSTI